MNGGARIALVVDLGASSLRMALIDETGATRAFGARPVDTDGPVPSHREQDPGEWLRLFRALLGELRGAADRRPDAIVVSGGTRTQVLVDARGRALRPALMWDDSRATREAQRLAAQFTIEGNPLTAFHPAARLAWLAAHEPGTVAATRAVLQPKDYLVQALTGVTVTDPVSNWMLLDDGGGYLSGLVEAAGFAAEKLPALAAPDAIVAAVAAGNPVDADLAGVPVLCGSMDSWCCALALGAYRDGALYNLSGTSEVVGAISGQRRFRDGILTVPWGNGLWHLGGPSQCGGRTVNWARGILGMTDGTLDSHVAMRANDVDAPLFVPYLDGERTPWWDAALTGAWLDLRSAHRRGDLLLAVVEGIAFHARAILEAVGAGGDAPVRIGGGLARSDTWCRVRADVLDRPVVRTAAAEPGLAGAAMLAMTGLGWCGELDAARARVAADARHFEPSPARRGDADARYARFRAHAAAPAA